MLFIKLIELGWTTKKSKENYFYTIQTFVLDLLFCLLNYVVLILLPLTLCLLLGKQSFIVFQNWYYKSFCCYWVPAQCTIHLETLQNLNPGKEKIFKYSQQYWVKLYWKYLYLEHKILLYNLFQDRLMAYQDSGFSEEDADHHVTTCLMKTPSGSIYIQPTSK